MNDLRYTVRSREVVDLIGAMRSERLTLRPYFQRNLVWRDAHKRDFIDTIRKGYPFPQIFLARGPINLESMTASQAVVDGQQRLTTIRDYIAGKIVDSTGRSFRQLPEREQEEFLKYEVAVIDFDLDVGDPRLKDVFHRLNRTFYSLSAIEKLASEYSASEFMLVARALSGEILRDEPDTSLIEELGDIGSDDNDEDIVENNIFSRDPAVDDETWVWLAGHAEGPFMQLIKKDHIFSSFEFDRKVPLMFTLNVMCTYINGYYERNNLVRRYLDDKADSFPERETVIKALNETAEFILDMNLPEKSMWLNKANLFTLIVELSRHPRLRKRGPEQAAVQLEALAASLPADYTLAAREAVGRKPQRELRGNVLREFLDEAPPLEEH